MWDLKILEHIHLKKIQFIISCPTNGVLEFLDLTLPFDITFKQIFGDVLENLAVVLSSIGSGHSMGTIGNGLVIGNG